MSTIAVRMDVHCNLELAALSRRPSRQTSPAHSRLCSIATPPTRTCGYMGP